MLTFLKRFFHQRRPAGDHPAQVEKVRAILRAELSQNNVRGERISHRRLPSLMKAAGTGRRETIRHLRAIGARPSSKLGLRVWTLRSGG